MGYGVWGRSNKGVLNFFQKSNISPKSAHIFMKFTPHIPIWFGKRGKRLMF
jgi:hypothetical protein